MTNASIRNYSEQKHRTSTLARWTIALMLSVGALLVPAICNGFPLVFADTGGYLARPFEGTLDIGRSALYGAFLALGIPFAFWPNVAIQAALCVWIIVLMLRTHGLAPTPAGTAATVSVLALLTALPWYASQLMPDVFASLAVLALYLLAFRSEALRQPARIGLIALVAAAMASHMGTLALALVIGAGLLVAQLLSRWAESLRPGLRLPALALGAGLLLAPLSNLAIVGQFAFTPGGTSFLFARLVQDGIIARYLDEHCPTRPLRLCAFRERLPPSADEWLWDYRSPLHELGWWEAYEPEARQIIIETLHRYPLAHAATALRAAASQFVTLRTGEGLGSRDNWHVEAILARYAPEVMQRFQASLQQHDRLDFAALKLLHVPLALLSAAGLALLALRPRWRGAGRSGLPLALAVLFALLANAAICGAFSNPNNRYQSRMAWLAPFGFAIVLAMRWRLPPEPWPP